MSDFFSMTPGQFSGNSVLGVQPSVPKPGVDPMSTVPAAGVGPQRKWYDMAYSNGAQGEKILGMTPNQFSATMGQFGASLTKPTSWQNKLGTVAAGMGQAKMLADAAKEQDKAMKAYLQDLLKSHGGSLAAANADPTTDSNTLMNMSIDPALSSAISLAILKHGQSATAGGGSTNG